MSNSLRLVITADPDIPVPPRLYGGIERVIALLANGLVARGHDVTLVAHRESTVACRLIPYPGASVLLNALAITRAAIRHRADVVHSFGRLATLLPLLPRRLPKVMSYQREVTPASVRLGRAIAGDSLTFVSCSQSLTRTLTGPSQWRVVHNGVDLSRFAFAGSVPSDAPLVFLGRIEPIKGAHIAIEVAKRSGRRLVLAGNIPAEYQAYFDSTIAPKIDGALVRYVGPVDDAAKSELLSGAAALLMPVNWEEPFGIVMAEALACGTPIIGLGRGAVPEVVSDGVTGFVCADQDAMVAAVAGIARLSRRACRGAAESRFSGQSLVDAYESLYRELVVRPRAAGELATAQSLPARRGR